MGGGPQPSRARRGQFDSRCATWDRFMRSANESGQSGLNCQTPSSKTGTDASEVGRGLRRTDASGYPGQLRRPGDAAGEINARYGARSRPQLLHPRLGPARLVQRARHVGDEPRGAIRARWADAPRHGAADRHALHRHRRRVRFRARPSDHRGTTNGSIPAISATVCSVLTGALHVAFFSRVTGLLAGEPTR